MRNIYKSPTQELTRLHFDVALFLSPNPQISSEINSVVEGRNLYITNSEDIKEGWYFNTSKAINKAVFIKNEDVKALKTIYGEKVNHLEKITLTTDTKLIEDGIQAIDDEFLQWYIWNPSCESVEVESFCKNGDDCPSHGAYDKQHLCNVGYEIIIPKKNIRMSFGEYLQHSNEIMTKHNLEYDKLLDKEFPVKTPTTFDELFKNTNIKPKIDEKGNKIWRFKADSK